MPTTITKTDIEQALSVIDGAIIEHPVERKAVAVLATAARFAVEASQRLDTLQAELDTCQAMCQRLATEAGQGQLTPAALRALADAAEDTAYLLTAPGDDCAGLLLAAEAARMAAGRMEASDDS
jgi:hypothetical protein